jgi:ABC-2 type transport system permease protein
MTAQRVTPPAPSALQQLRWTLHDCLLMTRRNLLRYIRLPENLVSVTIQPIMFLALFTYVLGGAIRVTTPDYVTFLLPGILVQTVLFGAFVTALGLTQDSQSGLFDRYRSLPMARSAVIVGRLSADILANIFVAALMIGVGYLMGFRFGGGLLESIGSPAIAILFALPVAGLFAALGLMARTAESVNVLGFIIIFPITFISSAFVPVDTMPSWLQPVAEHNPFTRAVDAARALALGQEATADITAALIWTGILTLIAIPLGVRAYTRAR